MGTTKTWLEGKDYADLAFVLLFEGMDEGWTTTDDVAGITTAIAATGRTSVRSGLHLPMGEIERSFTPFDAKLEPTQLSFRITDHDDHALSVFGKYAASTSSARVLDPMDNESTLVEGASMTPGVDYYIGHECVTADTATTVSVRGKYNLFTSDSGGTGGGSGWGERHKRDYQTLTYPVVDTYPTKHFNRRVNLYLHHRTDGVWSTTANAEIIWSGRIRGITIDNCDIIFSCTEIFDDLAGAVLLANQYQGRYENLVYVPQQYLVMLLGVFDDSNTEGPWFKSAEQLDDSDGNDLTTGFYTRAELIEALNRKLEEWWRAGGADWPTTDGSTKMRFEFRANDGLVEFCAYGDGGTPDRQYTGGVILGKTLSSALGFSDPSVQVDRAYESPAVGGGCIYTAFKVKFESRFDDAGVFAATVQGLYSPDGWIGGKYYLQGPSDNLSKIRIGGASGEYQRQPSLPSWAPYGTEAFFAVGNEKLIAVKETDTVNEFYVLGSIDGYSTVDLGLNGLPTYDQKAKGSIIVADGSIGATTVRQVWVEQGPIGDLFLRLLTSTGTEGYNHATYDDHPADVSLGIPWTAINYETVLRMGSWEYTLVLEKPTQFSTLFESALNLCDRNICWHAGKIEIRHTGGMAPPGEANISFTENNKAIPSNETDPQRCSMAIGYDGIINRITLKYGKTIDGKWPKSITLIDGASQTEYGQRRGITIEAHGLYDKNEQIGQPVLSWMNGPGKDVLALWAHPLAQVERTFDIQYLTKMSPGERCSITDQHLLDPTTGTRGVTNLQCWVLGMSFDFTRCCGKAKLVTHPEIKHSRLGTWCPSAEIQSYSAVTGIAACKDQYRDSWWRDTFTGDAKYFAVGDRVWVGAIGSTTPQSWLTTVSAIDSLGNDITLADTLTGFSSDVTYRIRYRDIMDVEDSQIETGTFLCNSTTLSTGKASHDEYLYSASHNAGTGYTTAKSFANNLYHYQSTGMSSDGQALSVDVMSDVYDWVRGAYAYCTQPVYLNQSLYTSHANPGVSNTLMYGPLFLPLMGGNMPIIVEPRCRVSGCTGTLTVVLCAEQVYGTSTTDFYYPSSSTFLSWEFGNTTSTYLAEQTFTSDNIPIAFNYGVPGTWLTIESSNTSASQFTYLHAISVMEDHW